jgi:hypothetical protein
MFFAILLPMAYIKDLLCETEILIVDEIDLPVDHYHSEDQNNGQGKLENNKAFRK